MHQMADSCSYGDTHWGSIKGHAALAKLTTGGHEVIGRAIDQRPKGEDGSHYTAFRTAMLKEKPHYDLKAATKVL